VFEPKVEAAPGIEPVGGKPPAVGAPIPEGGPKLPSEGRPDEAEAFPSDGAADPAAPPPPPPPRPKLGREDEDAFAGGVDVVLPPGNPKEGRDELDAAGGGLPPELS
jgi:hypothetical protein